MAYEDIYKGLSGKERERMLKQDIPKATVIGHFEMTEEERAEADKVLMDFITGKRKIGK